MSEAKQRLGRKFQRQLEARIRTRLTAAWLTEAEIEVVPPAYPGGVATVIFGPGAASKSKSRCSFKLYSPMLRLCYGITDLGCSRQAAGIRLASGWAVSAWNDNSSRVLSTVAMLHSKVAVYGLGAGAPLADIFGEVMRANAPTLLAGVTLYGPRGVGPWLWKPGFLRRRLSRGIFGIPPKTLMVEKVAYGFAAPTTRILNWRKALARLTESSESSESSS